MRMQHFIAPIIEYVLIIMSDDLNVKNPKYAIQQKCYWSISAKPDIQFNLQ